MMKKTIRLLALLLFSGLSFAQQPAEVTIPIGLRFRVLLKTPIDARKAKPGMPVELEALEDARDQSNKVVIPVHARLLGRVTEAIPWDKQKKNDSVVAFIVDSAQWKQGHATLKAYVVGGVQVVSSEINPEGASPMASCVEVSGSGISNGGCRTDIYRGRGADKTARLRLSDSRDIVSELYTNQHNLLVDSGSTFILKTMPMD